MPASIFGYLIWPGKRFDTFLRCDPWISCLYHPYLIISHTVQGDVKDIVRGFCCGLLNKLWCKSSQFKTRVQKTYPICDAKWPYCIYDQHSSKPHPISIYLGVPPPGSGHSARQYREIQQFVLGILVTFDGSCVSSPRIIASFFLSIRNQCSKLGIFWKQSLMLFQ